MEFLSPAEIRAAYGPDGITVPAPFMGFPAGCVTDDTQMALATAEGMLKALESGQENGASNPSSIVYGEYLAWLKSQDDPGERRAPGTTCVGALANGIMGTIEKPVNTSKGSGGVMRVAPAGLAYPPGQAFKMGAQFAAITHGHPCGYLPAGFIAEMISHIMHDQTPKEAVESAIAELAKWNGYEETYFFVNQAMDAALSPAPDNALVALGKGWVGEEALAIAVFCALKHENEFRGGLIAAVNHGGDSDTTGAITGAVLGAHLGADAIPEEWLAILEHREKIEKLAERFEGAFGQN